jgi:hypothetical protein
MIFSASGVNLIGPFQIIEKSIFLCKRLFSFTIIERSILHCFDIYTFLSCLWGKVSSILLWFRIKKLEIRESQVFQQTVD